MKLCDLETAKALQELGYDGEYTKMYNTSGELIDIDPLSAPYCIPAPALDDAAYWLRDKHRISIEPMWMGNEFRWSAALFDMEYRGILTLAHFTADTYEDALEAAVTKAIEIIKEQRNGDV